HAERDAQARQQAEERNAADTLAYSTEKTLREAGERLSETDRQGVQAALAELREALKGSDASRIKSAREHLEQVWAPVAQSLYSQAGASGQTSGRPGSDDVVDAEFRSSDEG
ncbi:MAG: Hsp70 family protein, partial [Chloroflexi bacterium]|nr:Hsp70 family protein [Chloroflexota bacterium]